MCKIRYNPILVICLIHLSFFGGSCQRQEKEISDENRDNATVSTSTIEQVMLDAINERIVRIGELAASIEQLRMEVRKLDEDQAVLSGGAREILDDLLSELDKKVWELEKERAALGQIIDSPSLRN